MDIKIIIASVVAFSAVGTGGYFAVTNDVSVEVNVPSEGIGSLIPTDDFRSLIPNYESLSFVEKRRGIKNVYDVLEPEQKIAAKREITALGKEVNRKAHEGLGESQATGFTPPGWEN